MTTYLPSFLSNQWHAEDGRANLLRNPVSGEPVAATGGAARGLQDGFEFARSHGRSALQAMTYGERAAMLSEILKVLQANRDAYYDISIANSGTTQNDSAVDIEGAAFTLDRKSVV